MRISQSTNPNIILLLPIDDTRSRLVDVPCGSGNTGSSSGKEWSCQVTFGSPTEFIFSYEAAADDKSKGS